MNKQLKTLDDLRRMTSVTISNALAAEVLRMDPARLAEYARQGMLGWNTTQSGNRILHSREGLIRYWSGVKDAPEPEEDIRHRMCLLLAEATEHLKIIERMLACMMSPHQRDVFQVAIAEEVERERRNEKTAGVAAPAEEKEP